MSSVLSTASDALASRVADAVAAAVRSINLSNNGYADIGRCDAVADGVRDAGFVVITTLDLHGKTVNRGFTPAAQRALAADAAAGSFFAASTYKPVRSRLDGPDYEAMILARQAGALLS